MIRGVGASKVAFLLVTSALGGIEIPPAASPAAPVGTRVVVLGTGTPNADPERAGPAIAVVVGDVPYLVDFGAGVVRRAEAARRAGVTALAMPNLRRAFLTHLHSDHTLGYADLILSPWVLEREQPLEVWGPQGLQAMTDHLLAAYQEDIRMRIYGSEPGNATGWKVVVHEINPGLIYKDENVSVEAFAVQHGTWPQAFGYTFQTVDRRIVISGDTVASDAVVDQCRGCDVLMHEVYSAERFLTRPPEWQAYHRAFHTSSTELAALATRAKPKLLVLYHQLFWGAADEELEAEVRKGYGGLVVSGRDLGTY